MSNDVVGLTPISDVESSLSLIFENTELDVQRVGLSELFLAKTPDKTFIVDSKGMSLLESASINYVTDGLIKTMHYGNKKQAHLSEFYHFARQGFFPTFGSSETPIVVFMDPTCPNCVSFHKRIAAGMIKDGNSFIYVPSLRDPSSKRGRNALLASYCSVGDTQFDNVQALYSDYRAASAKPIDRSQCIPLLEKVMDTAINTFVRHQMLGSPAFMMPDGEIIYGAKALARRLTKKNTIK
jgi:hypothetical protein